VVLTYTRGSFMMRRLQTAIFGLMLAGGGSPAAQSWHVAPQDLPGVDPASQFRRISEAAAQAGPGDTVWIHSGVYRESVEVDRSGTPGHPIVFAAVPGARVVLTGADEVAAWEKEPGAGDVYRTPWPHRFVGWNPQGTHPNDDHHLLIGRCEQVFVQGHPLQQVLAREQVGRGTFFVDLDAQRLLLGPRDGADLVGHPVRVEASVRGRVWQVRGDHVVRRGLRFRSAANHAQHGGGDFEGDFTVVEDCVFERMNAVGAAFRGEQITVRRCVFQDNGQLGFSASGAHGLRVTECLVRNNNVKGWNRGWEAGGNKLCLSRGVVLEHSRFVENRGAGIWADIGNEAMEVRNCLIADNEDAGIFYEISYGLHAHDNVIVGNGFHGTPGAWGASAGIALSSSPGCVIERNLLVGNHEGFNFREQSRRTPRIGGGPDQWVWNHDQLIRGNILAFNREAQVWGWFDVDDARHWPRAGPAAGPPQGGVAGPDLAAEYQAGDEPGAPTGLSLEALKIRFEHNLYATHPGQGLFHWGVPWKRHEQYPSLEALRRALGFEADGLEVELSFARPGARDFRLPAGSPALKGGGYPRGDVPGVRLGVLD